MNQTAPALASPVTEDAAIALNDKRNDVIDTLAAERIFSRKNKKGARVINAFDALEDLVILRTDGATEAEINTRIDAYVEAFKV